MIGQHIKDLIQAGLDGALDTQQQLELDAALAESESARSYQQELKALTELLDSVPPIEPPADMHTNIVQSVQLPKAPAKSFSWLSIPPMLRYGMTAAAGMLLAIGLYESQPQIGAADMDQMVGTITRGQQPGQRKLDAYSFDIEQVNSTVSLQQRDGSLVLDVQMESVEPVDVTVHFAGDVLGFGAFAQMQSQLDSIGFTDQALQLRGSGRQHFAVLLNPSENAENLPLARITVQWSVDGTVIKEGVLNTR